MLLLKICSPTLCNESRGLMAIIMFEFQYTPAFLESFAPIGRRSDTVHNPRGRQLNSRAVMINIILVYAFVLSDGTCLVKFLFKVSSVRC